ncbi:MAG: nicotinamide riboside transporter PnuC, partial [Spirochaetes bacterium]|nr:nicotinamide riboside transporter PnuC [Spirochaetota bacterium]
MEAIINLFSVNTTFFTILSYPMSYLEFVGTIMYLLSVILIAQKKMLTWPIGIVSVILYAILFYQIQLYSDTIEQLYYLGASVYGWVFWQKNKTTTEKSINFRYSTRKYILVFIIFTIGATLIVTIFMRNIHQILPVFFPTPASFPFLDALTTIMSFIAMFLMAQKRIESWIYWIIVDVIGIVLYFVKNVKFISLLYLILLIIAIRGFIKWHHEK